MLNMILDGSSVWKVDIMEGEKENGNQKEKTCAPHDEISRFGSVFSFQQNEKSNPMGQ